MAINMRLIDKLLKSSTVKETDTVDNSAILNNKETFTTNFPALNIALSGELDGGYNPGMLTIAGKSKNFKSLYGLLLAKSYMDQNEDSILILFDSEFGAPLEYFKSLNIDTTRVIHTPITNIEELKHEASVQLDNIERGDKVIFLVDSVGNLASNKEVEDAKDGKVVADMTRAKAFKSFGRIVTPKLTMKNVYMICINHTYDSMEMFSKPIVSGGTGMIFSSNDIWIVGKEQDKDAKTKEILGYTFSIKIEKSRKVREGTKIPILVSYDGGINKWTGMFDIALDAGFITSPKVGYYSTLQTADKLLRRRDIEYDDNFWNAMIKNVAFKEHIKNTYKLVSNKLINDDSAVVDEESD